MWVQMVKKGENKNDDSTPVRTRHQPKNIHAIAYPNEAAKSRSIRYWETKYSETWELGTPY